MTRDWFDATEAIEFARALAHDIDHIFPTEPKEERAKSAKKDRKKLDGLVRRTVAFAQSHKLNIYKKAKFLNTIKWELRDSGHEESLIDDILGVLTPLLSNRKP
jgi:hypothetical protein